MIELPTPASPPPEPPPEGWEGILEPGEQILWQGRPEPGIDWRSLDIPRALFGGVFTAFSLFWMIMAASIGPNGVIGVVFPLFGLPFLVVGLSMIGGQLLFDDRRRRGTHYTLTDRSAFVATKVLGQRRLHRTPLTPAMTVTLDEGEPGNLWFDDRADTARFAARRAMRNHRSSRPDPGHQTVGFERIAHPRMVWQLVQSSITALSASDPRP